MATLFRIQMRAEQGWRYPRRRGATVTGVQVVEGNRSGRRCAWHDGGRWPLQYAIERWEVPRQWRCIERRGSDRDKVIVYQYGTGKRSFARDDL